MAFNNRKIEFCGESRTFQRCTNKELLEYQKTLDAISDELIPYTEQNRDFQFKIEEVQEQINSIDKRIELMERLEDPTDEEIREAMNLSSQKSQLQKELHEIRVEKDNYDKENRDFAVGLDDKLREAYAKFASVIFKDFTEDIFYEYADSTDLVIAPRLNDLYKLATRGASQKDLEKACLEIINNSSSFQTG